jgi:hypothetical protein
MKHDELYNRLVTLEDDVSGAYYELIKDGKKFSFIEELLREYCDNELDITNLSEEEMLEELSSRGGEHELPAIEVRDHFSGDVYDAYVLSASNEGITSSKLEGEKVEYNLRFTEIATPFSKISLIKYMEEL